MKTGIIIQARLSSTRMPRKVIKPFYQDKSILDLQVLNLQKHVPHLPIILATSTNPENDALVEVAEKLQIQLFRGSEHDVLQRFVDAAQFYGFDKVVRVCSDNPLLDVASLEKLLYSNRDYAAFALSDNTPTIKSHYGFWPEVVKLSALEKAIELTQDPFYHEHVTNYIYGNPESFSLELTVIPKSIEQEKSIRTTIDTPQDFQNISSLYAELQQADCNLNAEEIVQFITHKPNYLAEMQSQIEQNSK